MRRAALLAVALAAPALAQGLEVPPLTGRVVDRADVLGASAEAALAARLEAHEDSTSNQVVVLTVPSLEGEVLEPYATRVFRTWGLGQAGQDNGVLLLVAIADRELRIEVGYGLEGSLTDAAAGAIIRSEIVPRFREGDFEGGVLAGVEAILGRLDGTVAPPRLASGDPGAPTHLGVLVILSLVLVPIAVLQGVMNGPGSPQAVLRGLLLAALAFVPLLLAFPRVGWPAVAAFALLVALVVGLVVGLDRWVGGHPRWGPWREHWRRKQAAFRSARRRGASTVVVDGRSYSVPTSSGGGYSGGGGSSGGGGASGSW